MPAHTAYIGLGSNLGDRFANLARAIERIRLLPSTHVEQQSKDYLTAPVGPQDQPHFANSVIRITTEFTPRDLLDSLKEIERLLGRKETYRWGPRLIDLDILLYDNVVMNERDLTIPHPEMHRREFVLEPLCEIAPHAEHPVIKKTAVEMLQNIRQRF